jgi:hypothetical protein
MLKLVEFTMKSYKFYVHIKNVFLIHKMRAKFGPKTELLVTIVGYKFSFISGQCVWPFKKVSF